MNINSLITNDAKTVGAEHVAISQMNEYRFDKILQGLDFTDDQIAYSKMLIVGRMVHPAASVIPCDGFLKQAGRRAVGLRG
ncbi:MAG: hypothetical protein HS127_16535 [Planctomycetia bacterium]|nr:hypothetical protein [Planctomycetia bacterium]